MTQLTRTEIESMSENHDWTMLRTRLGAMRAPDIADLVRVTEMPGRMLLFRCLPRKLAADVLSHFAGEDRDELLAELTGEETRNLLVHLRPDDRTELLEELPGEVTRRLLNLLSPEDLIEARRLLGYPEESVGRLMTPDYVAVHPEWTAGLALEHIRKMGRDSETINTVYVTDTGWKLIGALSLRQIVFAKREQLVKDLMTYPAISLSAFGDREEASRTMDRYDLFVLPVLDSDGVLVGIVTGDDVFEVAREEATEDFHKGAAVKPLKTSFKEASALLLVRNRIGWLMVLVLVDMMSAGVMARFEDIIAKVIPLCFFLPLLVGCSGNAGSQSSTLVVRELALGEVDSRDWARLLVKEMAISASLGLTIAAAVLGPGVLRGGSGVGGVVALSAVVIVTLGGVVGVGTPFLLSKLGFDPATSSSPLITSIADIVGVFIYFSIATWMLRL
jgi:magnesium transporter